ncbi:MAG: hypothetical protein JWQ96_3355 [Segetibacter sp.]|nr:hypothetical protein [Segetibacter sp.]
MMYLLKMLVCSGILFGYYRFALYNERFHQWNRFYLLVAMLLSVVVPFISIPVFTQEEQADIAVILASMPWNVAVVAQPEKPLFSLENVALFTLSLVTGVLLVRIIINITRLFITYKTNPVSSLNNTVKLILTRLNHAPFSFFNWLFWRQDIDPASDNGQRMLSHELTHIREHHSIDKIFTEVVLCMFWMNPFFWLMRRELATIHEFLADRRAIEQQDGAAFAAMILQALHVQPAHTSGLVNPFFSSQIKRRLLMITTSKEPKYSYLRRVSGLVVMLASAAILTLSIQQVQAQKQQKAVAKVSVDTTSKAAIILIEEVIAEENLKTDTSKAKKEKIQPLFILDGKEIGEKEMKSLHPNTIAAVNVFKGETAIAKYGAKGKNGVVVIRTKSAPIEVQAEEVTVIGFSTKNGKENEGELKEVVVAGKENKNFTPLIYVDGEEVTNEDLSKIPATDIEKINVLKGNHATEKYGDKGINGVLEITTKQELEVTTKQDVVIDKVFTKVQQPARFPGGEGAWIRYLEKNLKFPNAAETTAGTVRLQFIVDEKGFIRNVKILSDPGNGLAPEAVRLIIKSPNWEPAVQNGRVVNYQVILDIPFKPREAF